MARLYPCAYLVPAFGFTLIRGLARHAIVVALAVLPAVSLQGQLAFAFAEPGYYWIALLLKEVALGLLIGVILSLPFWLFESVGALLDNQRGALTGGQLNPALGADATPLGHLFKEMTVVVMMTLLGFDVLLQVLWSSYEVWPAMAWMPLPAGGFAGLMALINGTFTYLILYSAPFVAVLLIADFSMAMLSVYSPQLQVFVLAIPAKCLIGLAFLVIYLPTLWEHMSLRLQMFTDLIPSIKVLLGTVG
jgi:type III secretion protein T